MRRNVTAALGALALAGCIQNAGSLRMATSRNIATPYETVTRKVAGQDCANSVLMFIPLGKLNPTLEMAVNDALAKSANSEMLVNMSISQRVVFTVVWNQACILVEGDGARLAPAVAPAVQVAP